MFDDTNRFCGLAGEILATATEQMRLAAPPQRVSRPDSAVVIGCSPELDAPMQPSREQLAAAVRHALKS